MTIEDTAFQKVKIDRKKLTYFGFHGSPEGAYTYETDFCEDQFTAILTVDHSMRLSGTVIEKETGGG